MARDSIHEIVRTALEKENWDITHDPLTFRLGKNRVMVDLGIERILGIERADNKIAIEIKSFTRVSTLHAYYEALGQYIFYQDLLEFLENERLLYLAISSDAYEKLQRNELIVKSLEWRAIRLLIIDLESEKIEA